MPKKESLEERFWSKVNKTESCWIWTAGCFDSGYGIFWIEPKSIRAHRVSWTLHHGPIPEGMQVLHRCDVRNCVNPDHLYLGTALDNRKDTRARGPYRLTELEKNTIKLLHHYDVPITDLMDFFHRGFRAVKTLIEEEKGVSYE